MHWIALHCIVILSDTVICVVVGRGNGFVQCSATTFDNVFIVGSDGFDDCRR
jgi:hypothetical protein